MSTANSPYSALGTRLFELMSEVPTRPGWGAWDNGVSVGEFRLRITFGWLRTQVHVVARGTTTDVDRSWNAQLTRADHDRLVPLVLRARVLVDAVDAIAAVREFDRVMRDTRSALSALSVDQVSNGTPAKDPARAKLTDDAITIARRVLVAAENDSVSAADLMALVDKVREDLTS